MAGIYSQGGSAGHRYAGWLETVEAKNFTFGGKVFNGSPSAIYVGSNLVWWYWLKPATRQAIIGAFLDDGMAVINATNAYLNQLAASDRDKATALAGFINEDPMMVCSLGLQPQGVTMPIRQIDNNGTAWLDLDTGDLASTGFELEVEAAIKEKTSSWSVLASAGYGGLQFALNSTSGKMAFLYYTGGDIPGGMTNVIYAFVLNEFNKYIGSLINSVVTFKANGTQMYSYTTSRGTIGTSARLFNGDGVGTPVGIVNGIVRKATVRNNSRQVVGVLVPFKHKDGDNIVNCMLDMERMRLFFNRGTGQFTIPDISYTPSTP